MSTIPAAQSCSFARSFKLRQCRVASLNSMIKSPLPQKAKLVATYSLGSVSVRRLTQCEPQRKLLYLAVAPRIAK